MRWDVHTYIPLCLVTRRISCNDDESNCCRDCNYIQLRQNYISLYYNIVDECHNGCTLDGLVVSEGGEEMSEAAVDLMVVTGKYHHTNGLGSTKCVYH